ncbi:MAG: hypothetical protein Q8P11_01030 [bacterium]|nr:hypothetical protein [bacterium]
MRKNKTLIFVSLGQNIVNDEQDSYQLYRWPLVDKMQEMAREYQLFALRHFLVTLPDIHKHTVVIHGDKMCFALLKVICGQWKMKQFLCDDYEDTDCHPVACFNGSDWWALHECHTKIWICEQCKRWGLVGCGNNTLLSRILSRVNLAHLQISPQCNGDINQIKIIEDHKVPVTESFLTIPIGIF